MTAGDAISPSCKHDFNLTRARLPLAICQNLAPTSIVIDDDAISPSSGNGKALPKLERRWKCYYSLTNTGTEAISGSAAPLAAIIFTLP
jgi:hypothetical protein